MQRFALAIIMALPPFLAIAQSGGPPPVPVSGAYFGAWANPDGTANTTSNGVELAAESLEARIGRKLDLHMHYFSWKKGAAVSFPDVGMYEDYAHGRIAVVTWACGGTDEIANVLAGADNALIDATAAAIKIFPGPIFLRWYWEMNLAAGANGQDCMEPSGADAGAAGYIAAWRYIHDRFMITDGVTNVAWLWNPAGSTLDPTSVPFYPGDAYVDWIGFDGYDKIQANNFGPVFATFYGDFSSHAKPFLIGETGECQGENASYGAQATYIPLAQAEIKSKPNAGSYAFPLVKGFMYFDAAGHYGTTHPTCPTWVFDSAGLAAFAAMGADAYFGAGNDVIFRNGFEANP